MNSDWDNTTLGEEIELLYGKGLPKRVRQEGDIPVYGSNGIIDYHNEALVKGPGIIIGRKGSVGEIKFSDSDFFPIDTTYYLKLKKEGDLVFWYYFLQILGLTKMNTHSAVPGLNRELVYQIPVTIPNLSSQKKIGGLLRSLDNKIEVNTLLNYNFEKLGETLFKRWFIDFEFPDEKGYPYRSSGGAMKETSHEEIPDYWELVSLGEITNIIMGQSPPGNSYNEEKDGLPFYQGIRDFGFRYPSKRVYCTDPKRVVGEGTVLLSVRAPIGSINLSKEKAIIGRGLCGLSLEKGYNGFLYYFLKTESDLWNIYNDEGTVFGAIKKSDIQNTSIIKPDENTLSIFNDVIKAIDNYILSTENQNILFSELRDVLLPLLMSGEIRVNV